MKEIRKLPASAGAQWLLDTFSLYRRAPLQLARIGLTWLLVSWGVTLLSTLIPGAAGMAVQLMTLAISPIMFGGMLYAVGEIDEGRPGLASHLLQPIRDHRVSHLLVPLAIGVLIDDAIVVRENIVRHMEMGSDRRTAALARAKGFTTQSRAHDDLPCRDKTRILYWHWRYYEPARDGRRRRTERSSLHQTSKAHQLGRGHRRPDEA